MAVRKIVRMGHPVLRQRARELTAAEIRSDKIAALVDDMVETLHDYGGIGLAAPFPHNSCRGYLQFVGCCRQCVKVVRPGTTKTNNTRPGLCHRSLEVMAKFVRLVAINYRVRQVQAFYPHFNAGLFNQRVLKNL